MRSQIGEDEGNNDHLNNFFFELDNAAAAEDQKLLILGLALDVLKFHSKGMLRRTLANTMGCMLT